MILLSSLKEVRHYDLKTDSTINIHIQKGFNVHQLLSSLRY